MKFYLRPWETSDLESLVKYAGNPQITRFMSDGFANLSTPEGATKFIEFANSGSDKLYRAIEINGEAVGGIAFRFKLIFTGQMPNSAIGWPNLFGEGESSPKQSP